MELLPQGANFAPDKLFTMTNKEIAQAFQELAALMELHGENGFKIRSYNQAYLTLRKLAEPLAEMPADQREKIPGVGKAIAEKIGSLLETGSIPTLERFREMTPPGVRELLAVKGLGPKKLAVLWKELGIESPGELLYACNENRLVELSGFGQKTQADIADKLRFFYAHRHQQLYANLRLPAEELHAALLDAVGEGGVVETGALRRRDPVLSELEFLAWGNARECPWPEGLRWEERTGSHWLGQWDERIPVRLYWQGEESRAAAWVKTTGDEDFVAGLTSRGVEWGGDDETGLLRSAGLPFIQPERRNALAPQDERTLVELTDIKGLVHAHSQWSDGMNSIAEMAEAAGKAGLQYMCMTDHSRAAFYANGLSEERVEQQFAEIDKLNAQLGDFVIFKGIEADILHDGSLDYDDALLARFDLVIASVHSNLKMDEARAMHRLLRAIENPRTHMLGHPTGRLLLARAGYPVDHQKIIDACAANKVAIEINANPNRLDLDWTWVRRALDKGVFISINPDAHSVAGIRDIQYGILAARKAGMTAEECLNARDAKGFGSFLRQRQ